jgi:hypothetical protein
VEIRYFVDQETGQPHIHMHGVTESEVTEVLSTPLEDGGGAEDSRVAIGQTDAGRFLKVIYVPDPDRDGVFVISAYDLGQKARKALRRRLRRRK